MPLGRPYPGTGLLLPGVYRHAPAYSEIGSEPGTLGLAAHQHDVDGLRVAERLQ